MRRLLDAGWCTSRGAPTPSARGSSSRPASTPPTCPGSPCRRRRSGLPDLGLIGLDDVAGAVTADHGRASAIPLIADIDTGFGGPLNVRRTVVEVEAAGAAAVQIEDQVAPKRCGHFEDKAIVDAAEAVERVAVAVGRAARRHGRHRPHRRHRRRRRRRRRSTGPGRSSPPAPTSCSSRPSSDVEPAAPRRAPPSRARHCCTTPSRAAARRCSTTATLAAAGVRIVLHPVTLLLETIRAQRAALAALGAAGRRRRRRSPTPASVVGADAAIAFHATPPTTH